MMRLVLFLVSAECKDLLLSQGIIFDVELLGLIFDYMIRD